MICESGKRTYLTEETATAALQVCHEQAAKGFVRRMERGLYRCTLCDAWHLTSFPRRPLAADELPAAVARLQRRFG